MEADLATFVAAAGALGGAALAEFKVRREAVTKKARAFYVAAGAAVGAAVAALAAAVVEAVK